MIHKIHDVDPMICPKCQGVIWIIGSAEDQAVIRTILEYPGIWLVRSKPPPKIYDPPAFMHSTGRPLVYSHGKREFISKKFLGSVFEGLTGHTEINSIAGIL